MSIWRSTSGIQVGDVITIRHQSGSTRQATVTKLLPNGGLFAGDGRKTRNKFNEAGMGNWERIIETEEN